MRPKAVLLDCDGVLVDSEPVAFDLIAAEFAGAGLNLPREVLEAELQGATIPFIHRRARDWGLDLPETWVAEVYEALYARLARGTPLIEGVEALLDRLDEAGVPYAVGSNGHGRKMALMLNQHPQVMARLEGRLFSGQDLGMPKPEPGLWLHCAAVLGVAPEHCVVVDDSVPGVRAAVRAGIPAYGYAPHGGETLAAEGAVVFRRMEDLPGLWGL